MTIVQFSIDLRSDSECFIWEFENKEINLHEHNEHSVINSHENVNYNPKYPSII